MKLVTMMPKFKITKDILMVSSCLNLMNRLNIRKKAKINNVKIAGYILKARTNSPLNKNKAAR